jgi:2-aminoethylphosphonate-pyruvate transaminase
VPGVSFAVLSQELVNIARNRVRRTFYSDLMMHLDRESNGEMPFTPPVQPLFAFREALKEVMEEGVANRILHYQNISSRLRAGAKDLGLRLFLDERLYSNTMTSVHLSPDVTFEELHDTLKQRGFIIYNAHGRLRGQLFMLGVVGAITVSDIEDFLAALGDVLEEVR